MEEIKILFDKYNGRISIDQIVDGISCCLENAKELLVDAQILRQAKRYPRSLSLLLMSMQEAGKIEILRKMSTISKAEQKKWKILWKQFRSHERKDALGYSQIICTEFSKSAGDIFWEQLIYDKNFSNAKEKTRQFALYVDYIGSGNEWWSPIDIKDTLVQQAEDDAVLVLYKLDRMKEMGLFTVKALTIYNEEFANYTPDIELNKEYDQDDFGNRLFGVHGPYKRYLKRLIDEGVIEKIPDDMLVMGKSLNDFINS